MYFKIKSTEKQNRNYCQISHFFPLGDKTNKKNTLMHEVKYGTIIYLLKEVELLIKMYI